MEPSDLQPQTPPLTPPTPPPSPPSPHRPTVLIIALIGLGLLSASLLIWFLIARPKPNPQVNSINSPPTPLPTQNSSAATPTPEKLRTWISCNDVRDVIEDGEIIYVGCLDGVLIVNQKTGSVIDELNFQDGFASNTVTDLVLYQQKLYIGTQGGLHIYDLNTHQLEIISSLNGLPSDNNLELALDSTSLWIGTFKGLARLNLSNHQLETFTSVLPVDNPATNISNLLVTPNSFYAYAGSNANTQGYVVRYDKAAQTWSSWGKDNDLHVYKLDYFDGHIYIYQSDRISIAQDAPDAPWNDYFSIQTALSLQSPQDSLPHCLGSINQYAYLVKDQKIYQHDYSTQSLSLLAQDYPFSQNLPILTDKIWIFSITNKDPWLTKYNLNPVKKSILTLSRPAAFYRILGMVNQDAFLLTDQGTTMISLDSQELTFSVVSDKAPHSPDYADVQMIPIPKTSSIMFVKQSCVMGCSQPEFNLYDYATKTYQPLTPDQNIAQIIRGPNDENTNYQDINLLGLDEEGKVWFETYTQTNDMIRFSYHPNGGWSSSSASPTLTLEIPGSCSLVAAYDPTQKAFSQVDLSDCDPSSTIPGSSANITSLVSLPEMTIGTYKWNGLFVMR